MSVASIDTSNIGIPMTKSNSVEDISEDWAWAGYRTDWHTKYFFLKQSPIRHIPEFDMKVTQSWLRYAYTGFVSQDTKSVPELSVQRQGPSH
jgi:hypothetical protein